MTATDRQEGRLPVVQHGTRQPKTHPAEPPLVSVVLATYNGQRFIRTTLESVLRQDHPAVEVAG